MHCQNLEPTSAIGVVGEVDVSEAVVAHQLHGSCAQALRKRHKGLLCWDLCGNHARIHSCSCQLPLHGGQTVNGQHAAAKWCALSKTAV